MKWYLISVTLLIAIVIYIYLSSHNREQWNIGFKELFSSVLFVLAPILVVNEIKRFRKAAQDN
ncbi:MAG: hypothetical protein HWE27_10990 [Gammaproteobacteria bacterium]|nr:hypothetical protein [Gammaproteobacteria bacterium]